MKVEIRTFRTEDHPAARKLILTGLGEHFGHIDENLNPDVNDIEASYMVKGRAFFVAESDDQIVGTGGFVCEQPGVGRIVRMSVRRDCRRKGIGRRMVEHLLTEARRQGCTKVLLETNHDWDDAVRFYRACGFAESHRDEVSAHLYLHLC